MTNKPASTSPLTPQEQKSVDELALSLQEPTDSVDPINSFFGDGERFGSGREATKEGYDSLRLHLKDILNEVVEEVEEQGPPNALLNPGNDNTPVAWMETNHQNTLTGLPTRADQPKGDDLPTDRDHSITQTLHRPTTLTLPRNAQAGEYRGSGFILLKTSEIREAVGTGEFRLRISGREFGPLNETAVAELIKHGVFMGDGEIADLDGPWMPVMEHPIFIRLREQMATKAHQLLRELNIPGRTDQPEIPQTPEPVAAPEPVATPEPVAITETVTAPKPAVITETAALEVIDNPTTPWKMPLLTLMIGLSLGLGMGWFLGSGGLLLF